MTAVQMRQGDILFTPIDVPADVVKRACRVDGGVVAEGEATGHAHRLDGGEFFRHASMNFIVPGSGGAVIRHEEHAPVSFEAGQNYEVRQQQEWDGTQQRTVLD